MSSGIPLGMPLGIPSAGSIQLAILDLAKQGNVSVRKMASTHGCGTKFGERMSEHFDWEKTRSGKYYFGVGLSRAEDNDPNW